MWWVKEHPDHGRGGFQDRDVGRTSFNFDLGPEYGIDYARYADPPDPRFDALLSDKVNDRLFTEFAEDYGNLEVFVRNGFVILKGKLADPAIKESLVKRIYAITGVREVITKFVIENHY